MAHFEQVGDRPVLYVEGSPFTILSVEIPWMRLIYGKYNETLGAYDYLYPAAKEMGLNALKVPIKWSMVEPHPGSFDFSYFDHVKATAEENGLKLVIGWFGHYASGDGNIYRNLSGEVFAPMDIILDEETYPRAVDGDGISHHNSISYDYDAVVEREISAFRALMEHIRKVDSEDRTVLMVQVENEIAVFGSDRDNRLMWRDHSPASNKLYSEQGYSDDLRYSADRFSSNWIRRVTQAGGEVYPLPFFLNFVGGKRVDWMVGGAPGEDVATYLRYCPFISFVGLNLYLSPDSSANDLRQALRAYSVDRNMPSITETNSGPGPMAPRLAFVSIGEFGSPIFAPWALNISYPTPFRPYVLEDGTLANGAFDLRDTYLALSQAMPVVSLFGGTENLKVFMAQFPGDRFSQTRDLSGSKITVSGQGNGQAMVIKTAENEFFALGFKCSVTLADSGFVWPGLQKVTVEKGAFEGDRWVASGEPRYTFNQSAQTLGLRLERPQVLRVYW